MQAGLLGRKSRYTIGKELIVDTYCFALRGPRDSERHLRVGEFPAPETAFGFADLIAQELGLEVEWQGWSVEVRSMQGRTLFAVPVGDKSTLAA